MSFRAVPGLLAVVFLTAHAGFAQVDIRPVSAELHVVVESCGVCGVSGGKVWRCAAV